MGINLSEKYLGVYEKALPAFLSWEEKFRITKEAGFDFIELSIDATPERLSRLYWSQRQIDELLGCIARFQMPIYTMALSANRMYPLGSEDAAIRGKGIEIVCTAVDLAVRLGVRLIQMCTYDVFGQESTASTDALFRAALQIVGGYAADRGVMLALEIMEAPYSDTPEKLMRFIKEVNSPYLQIYADIGNLVASGYDDPTMLRDYMKNIVAIHVKDTTPGCYREILYGEGTVDFEHFLQAIGEMNFHGFLVAEMWSKDEETFIPYLGQACSFIRGKIKTAQNRTNPDSWQLPVAVG